MHIMQAICLKQYIINLKASMTLIFFSCYLTKYQPNHTFFKLKKKNLNNPIWWKLHIVDRRRTVYTSNSKKPLTRVLLIPGHFSI